MCNQTSTHMNDYYPVEHSINMNVPPAAQITLEQAQSLNLVKSMDFVCGQNIIDLPIEGQKYAIVCTVPCKNAVADENGNYAFAKVRGVYASVESAENAAQEIVRSQDQLCVNTIVHVGRPYPIRANTNLPIDHTIQVDIQEPCKKAWRNHAKVQREADQLAQDQVFAKEKALREEVSAPVDDEMEYCMLRAKMAHWTHMLDEFDKNKAQVEQKLLRGHEQVVQMDRTNPEFQHVFLEKIQAEEARSGFEFGKSAEMDSMLYERRDRLTNYKKFAPHLFD